MTVETRNSVTDRERVRTATPISPKNLRVEMDPYPHLRDDDGCILARDQYDAGKLAFILNAVRQVGAGE